MDYIKTLRLDQVGMERLLGDREATIMEYLWGRKDVSVREIHRWLSQSEEIAYTTVMTITDRLWQKGLLDRYQAGKSYLYTPTESRESFVAGSMSRILGAVLPDFGEAALVKFVDSMAKDRPELLDDLQRLIEAKKRAEA